MPCAPVTPAPSAGSRLASQHASLIQASTLQPPVSQPYDWQASGITTSELLSRCITTSSHGQHQHGPLPTDCQSDVQSRRSSQHGVLGTEQHTDAVMQSSTAPQPDPQPSLPEQLFDAVLALFNVESLAGKVSGILLDALGYSEDAAGDAWDQSGLRAMLEDSDLLHARVHEVRACACI